MKKLIVMILVFSFQAMAGEAQIQRFEKWFKILEKDLATGSASEAADSLLKGSSRVAAFNLQALGKIYQDKDARFKDLRKDFKKLEDAIGEYNKWDDILTEARNRGSSSSKIKKLSEKRKVARDELKDLVETKDWLENSKLREHRKFILNHDFGTYAEDKAFAVGHLIEGLEELDASDFDMTVLEEGNGVHELRRELRWFAIKARILNGLVIFKENNRYCPIRELRNLPFRPVAGSKYATLPPNKLESDPCEISQCLFLGMVEKINQFGELKDKIERDLNLQDEPGDETPAKYLPELYRLYNELIELDLLKILGSQMKSCL